MSNHGDADDDTNNAGTETGGTEPAADAGDGLAYPFGETPPELTEWTEYTELAPLNWSAIKQRVLKKTNRQCAKCGTAHEEMFVTFRLQPRDFEDPRNAFVEDNLFAVCSEHFRHWLPLPGGEERTLTKDEWDLLWCPTNHDLDAVPKGVDDDEYQTLRSAELSDRTAYVNIGDAVHVPEMGSDTEFEESVEGGLKDADFTTEDGVVDYSTFDADGTGGQDNGQDSE